MANSILDGLYRLLAETIVLPDHPLRAKLDALLAGLAQDLQSDAALRAKVGRLKARLLENPEMAAWLETLWTSTKASALQKLAQASSQNASFPAPESQLAQSLQALGQALLQDAALANALNRFARRTLAGGAVRYGDSLVTLVSDTIRGWDTATVTARIEGAVGRDLQFIRINGTVVGGLVGLALHALAG